MQVEMSKTHQYRKVMKPLLERKRRARINKCLDELKDLMIDCMTQHGENVVRLEKADILELTVDHLRRLSKKTTTSSTINETNESFRSGYVHAANEVSKALASLPKVDINLGTKLMTHLGHRLNEIQQIPSAAAATSNKPLTIYCAGNYYGPPAFSPASSGYGSDYDCPTTRTTTRELLQITEKPKSNVWRPW